MNAREVVQVGIRCLSLAMMIVAVAIVVWWAIEAIQDSIKLITAGRTDRLWNTLDSNWYLFYSSNSFVWTFSLLLLALALWLAQQRLARLVVPDLGRTCPECGYSLRNRKSPGCPECGAGMTPSTPDPDQSTSASKANGK